MLNSYFKNLKVKISHNSYDLFFLIYYSLLPELCQHCARCFDYGVKRKLCWHNVYLTQVLSFCNWIFIIHGKVIFPFLYWYKQHGHLLHVWLLEGFIQLMTMLCSVSKLREHLLNEKTPFQLNCKLHDIFILNTFALGIWPFEIIQEWEYFRAKKHLEKLCVLLLKKNFIETFLQPHFSMC